MPVAGAWKRRGTASIERTQRAAVTPVAAMHHLRHINDRYGGNPGRAVVRDFLGCSVAWTGPAARRIKAELIGLLEDRH